MAQLISVIIPTYNRPRLLMDRALASMFAQTDQQQEVLVIGDGTDQQTVREMTALCAENPFVRFWNLPRYPYPDDPTERWGLYGLRALNWGLDHAEGEWIAVLGDDDEWLPWHHEILLDAALRSGADHVYGVSETYKEGVDTGQRYGSWPPGDGAFCVPADARINASGVLSVYRRKYDGPMVRITTKRGRELTCTPNHRVAAGNGWVESDKIQVGDYVVTHGFDHGHSSGNPDVDHMPPTIEEIFDSLAVSPHWMVRRRVDFDGDEIIHREVDVVASDSMLGAYGDSSIKKPLTESILSPSCVRFVGLFLDSDLPSRFEAMSSAAQGGVGMFRQGESLVGRHSGVLGDGGSRKSPPLDIRPDQQPSDCPLADLEVTGERDGRESFFVETDQVVGIDRVPLAGHVYNLSTPTRWYSANEIVTHNCNGANLYRRSLGYRYDLGCWTRGRTGDADLWTRMYEDGVKFHFENQIVHRYHRGWP